MNKTDFIVPADTEKIQLPIRLDSYAALVQGISRSRLKTGIQSITVNGKKAKLSVQLKGGEKVSLSWQDPIPTYIEPENIPLDIIYENETVSIINKKQGMVVHPAAGNWDGTLVNALLYHWGKSTIKHNSDTSPQNHNLRPGIVHRLDKDTSGCIITARNRDQEVWLQERFKERRVQKEYVCIVCGHPPEKQGVIKTQIIRDRRNRKRFITEKDPKKGKFAHSLYRCIAIYGPYALMRVRLKTGRTHQIRVHMKHIACPILGDKIYGTKDGLFGTATLMLHARTLGIQLTPESSFQTFNAPIPIRFKKVLHTLHKTYEKCTFH
ncbi:MAG TPA: RluA family pseudouridine synthase [Treponemataceae bacterium]|nr:RluA family pseudouridine synthase [Treponemataceae bacterium]